MTVADWLESRTPVPHGVLADRIRTALQPHLAHAANNAAQLCLDASQQMLVQLLQTGSTSRETATDLLAVDAMVTYAFEAAAESRNTDLDALAAEAMQRIAQVPSQLEGRSA